MLKYMVYLLFGFPYIHRLVSNWWQQHFAFCCVFSIMFLYEVMASLKPSSTHTNNIYLQRTSQNNTSPIRLSAAALSYQHFLQTRLWCWLSLCTPLGSYLRAAAYRVSVSHIVFIKLHQATTTPTVGLALHSLLCNSEAVYSLSAHTCTCFVHTLNLFYQQFCLSTSSLLHAVWNNLQQSALQHQHIHPCC